MITEDTKVLLLSLLLSSVEKALQMPSLFLHCSLLLSLTHSLCMGETGLIVVFVTCSKGIIRGHNCKGITRRPSCLFYFELLPSHVPTSPLSTAEFPTGSLIHLMALFITNCFPSFSCSVYFYCCSPSHLFLCSSSFIFTSPFLGHSRSLTIPCFTQLI